MEGGLFDIPQLAPAAGRAAAPRDRARPGRGLGRRGGRPGHRRADAQRRQAPGGRTPTPRRGRSRRGDLRLAGRARAASAPAARRLHAVGLAAHPPGRRGPRRRLDEPPPAAHRRRPRRPARLPRGLGRPGGAERRRLRRRAAQPARAATPRTHADGGRRPRASERPRGGAPCAADLESAVAVPRRRCATQLRGAPGRAPGRAERACSPGHLTAGTLVLSAGLDAVLLNLHGRAGRWFHFGGHWEPGDASLLATASREATEESGIADLRRASRARSTSTCTRWSSAAGTSAPTTSTCGTPPWHRPVRTPRASDESLDVRWWPLDDLPDLEPEMHELIALVARAACSVGGSRRPARAERRGVAVEPGLRPLGLRVAADPPPRTGRCARPRSGGPARGRARSRPPSRACPGAAARAGWSGRPACTSPSGCAGCRPSGRWPAARARSARYG